jgi:hypothetical protein
MFSLWAASNGVRALIAALNGRPVSDEAPYVTETMPVVDDGMTLYSSFLGQA